MESTATTLQKETQKPVKPKKRIVWVFVGVGVVLLVAFFARSLLSQSEEIVSTQAEQAAEVVLPEASPTPFPFMEMTIPYLRDQEFGSSLGERSVAYNGSNYTAYVTSYESDGLRVNGLLTIPNREEPSGGFPAIVFIHGYIPPTTYQTTQNYYDYVDYLARNGFVVFKIDLRGHGSSEGEPGGAYYSSDYIVDVLNARAALQAAEFVNPEKIGLWGHSMAGNVVLRSLVARPEIPAAVIWAGAVYTYQDWQKYQINDNSYRPPGMSTQRQRRRQELFDTHGEFDPTSPFWSQVAATNYLSDIQGAIQLNHAINDDVVNIGYSRDLNSLLDQTAVPHELHEYAGGGHNITGSYFTQAMQNAVRFFQEHLGEGN